MRIVIGHLSHETNVFNPVKTTYAEFAKRDLERGEEIFQKWADTKTEIGGIIEAARRGGAEVIPTIAAGGWVGGIVDRSAFEGFLQELLDGIRNAGKIDGVMLALHGAMRVEDIPDGEGYILEKVRELVGSKIPVVASLDWHSNTTEKMVRNADALHIYDTYPHVDMYETGVEACNNLIRIIKGEINPKMGFSQIPLAIALTFQYTGAIPMSTIMEYVHRLKKSNPKIIDISVAGGFPWADFEDSVSSVTVVTDNDQALAQRTAAEVADLAWNLRKLIARPLVKPHDAVRMAMASAKGPVVLADVADNPGAGGSSDGAEILRALIECQAKKAAFATICDPEALGKCIEAGVGNTVTTLLGGKLDNHRGRPVEVTGRVKVLSDGFYLRKGPMRTGFIDKMGRMAVLNIDGIQVIINELRAQTYDLEVFRSVGIEPTDQQILCVKSCVHYRAAFEPIAKGGVIEVDAPGLSHPDLKRFDFKGIRRPVYPLDEM